MGFLVTMRGQYYFKISMSLVGMVFGSYVGYTISNYSGNFSESGTVQFSSTHVFKLSKSEMNKEILFSGIVITAVLTGVLTSFIWLIFWMSVSSPIPSLTLSGLTLGSLFFYIFYFGIPGTCHYCIEETTTSRV